MEYVFDDYNVTVTNVHRIVFPDVGIEKGEILAYYKDIADVMVPELRGRPLSIERFTKSIDEGGFFQKHVQKHYPHWIDREELGVKTRVVYPICNTPSALLYFANQGGFVMHIWPSRRERPEYPDTLIFDLDPPENRFDLVRDAARHIKDVLDEVDLSAFVKVTGSKGLHIVAPLDGKATFADVNELTNGISRMLVERYPETLTMEFYKKDRKGRLFLDSLRNAMGATYVAPYSLRARPGSPVSAPIEWEELDDVTANGIKMRDVRRRLDSIGDPWSNLRVRPGNVAKAMRKLEAL